LLSVFPLVSARNRRAPIEFPPLPVPDHPETHSSLSTSGDRVSTTLLPESTTEVTGLGAATTADPLLWCPSLF
jgi:hypothetical protein